MSIEKRKQDYMNFCREVWWDAMQERKKVGMPEVSFDDYKNKNDYWLAQEYEQAKQQRIF